MRSEFFIDELFAVKKLSQVYGFLFIFICSRVDSFIMRLFLFPVGVPVLL